MTKVTLTQEYTLEDTTYGPGEVEVDDTLAHYLESAEAAHQRRMKRVAATPTPAAPPARSRRARAVEPEVTP